MKAYSLIFLMIFISGCAVRDAETVSLSQETELVPVDFELKRGFVYANIEDLDIRLAPGFSEDWYSDIYLELLEVRLSAKDMKKLSDKDLENLERRFIKAREKVFEANELADQVSPETLVLKTYMTDGTRSNVPLNWLATGIIGSLDVGNVALYSEGFIGERRVSAASGAYDGKIIIEGYTKWGIVEGALMEWLDGARRLFITEIPEVQP